MSAVWIYPIAICIVNVVLWVVLIRIWRETKAIGREIAEQERRLTGR